MGEAVNREVAVRAALVVADFPAHAFGEDFRPAAGQRIEARLLQLLQDLLVRAAVEIREEGDLDCGEALQMNVGTDAFETAEHVRVVREGQVGVQSVDDVDFGEGLAGAVPELVPRLFQRHRVGAGIAGAQARERAEEAARDAHVGRLETDVDVVVGPPAVALLALAVGQPAERERVRAAEERDAVLERQPRPRLEPPRDIAEPCSLDSVQHDSLV